MNASRTVFMAAVAAFGLAAGGVEARAQGGGVIDVGRPGGRVLIDPGRPGVGSCPATTRARPAVG
ncbi:hypothetical protein [Paludisphaera soli]|uniref:hypothetical protein n=1 Tax=Paludisphaera soli TaxID=2712865 RepID=UPI0013EAE712|nr:hypothetical protein [Paludisphaera soli]